MDQPPRVRLNVCFLVASLNSKPVGARGEAAVPYIPALDFHLKVLEDPDQFVVCKVWAANGMGRIGKDSLPSASQRSQMANALVAAWAAPDAGAPQNLWYRLRLVDALGCCGLSHDVTRKPVVVDTLMAVLRNPDRHWLVRSSAARGISQVPLEAKTEVPLICYELARLTQQMAQARNQDLKAPHWTYCFLNVYRTFRAHTQQEQAKGWGLNNLVSKPGLSQHRPVATALFEKILPIVNSVVEPPEPTATPQQSLQELNDWIKNNVPQNWKVTPESEELQQTEEDQPPMAGSTSGAANAARALFSWRL